MRKVLLVLLVLLLLVCGTGAASASTGLGVHAMRALSTADPHGLIVKVRAALDAGTYANNPAGEREALWWMGHAGINISDDAVVTEAVARLKSLANVGHDKLAESYAGFLSADLRVLHGDGGGVTDALRAAELQLDSPDPAHRALAKFQLCDVYSMAGQYQHSDPLCRSAAEAFAAQGDDWQLAQARNDQGNNAYGLGRYADAARFYLEARALYRKAGDRPQMLMVGDNLAQVYLKQGKPEQAITLSRDSLANERAAGREGDALTSQYNIARALQAMGQQRKAMDLISATVEQARKAHFGAGLPDLLREQSRMAERDGNLKLALDASREAYQAAHRQWSKNLASQQADLAARYAARETEIRIQTLERNSQMRKLRLQAAEAEAASNALKVRRQRATLVASVLAAIGLLVGVISLLVLLRSQRRHTRELRRQALEDPLTGVANRRGFFGHAEAMLRDRGAGQPPLHALLLFDFDNFKHINDRCGHPFGDIVLNVSLQRLREVVGARGCLARLGGEEFVVLCPHVGGAGALRLAEEMRAAMGALQLPDAPDDLLVTISIGVALYDGVRCHDLGSWMGSADRAMYAAKSRGRDQVVVAHAVNGLLNRTAAEVQPAQ